MAYGIQQLRPRNIMSGYGFEPESSGYDPGMDDYGYDPMMDSSGYNVGEILSPYMRAQTPSAPPTTQSVPSSGRAGVAPDPGLSDSIRRSMDAINQVYTPETTDRDRLRALMDAAPEREAPSFGRALVAGGLSLKAADPIAASESVMMAPHRRNMADWLAKTDPFHKTAQLEQQANVNERTLAGNVVNAETQARRIEMQERNNQARNEAAMIRARAAKLTAELGRGWDWDLSGTTIKKKNNTTGEVIDTGMRTDKLSEEDRLELQNEGRVQAARETSLYAGARNTQNAPLYQDNKGTFRIDVNGEKEYVSMGTEPTTRVGAPGRINETTPAEFKSEEQRRLRPVYEQYPKQFNNRNGVLELKPRPKPGWFGDTSAQDEWDTVKKLIDPNYKVPVKIPKTSSPLGGELQNVPYTSSTPTKGIGPSENSTVSVNQRAAEFLRKNGLPVTQANIEHAKRTGRVK